MNALEREGAAAVVSKVIKILEKLFPEVIGNDRTCPECYATGYGTPTTHKPACPGRSALLGMGEVRKLLS